MAIVEMKRITLLALRQDQHKLLKAMQRLGCVEVSRLTDEETEQWKVKDDGRLASLEAVSTRLNWTIHTMGRYDPQKAPFMGARPEAPAEEVAWIETHETELMQVLDEADKLEHKGGELRGALTRLQAASDQLQPWLALDIPVEQIRSTKNLWQAAGTVNKNALQELIGKWEGKAAVITPLGEQRENACLWAAVHESEKEAFLQDLKEAGFAQVSFGESSGTPKQQLDAIEAERADIHRQEAELEESWKQLSKHQTRLKTWFDMVGIEIDRLQAAQRTVGTGTVFLMRGWVPAAAAGKVTETLNKLSPTCAVEITDPEEGEEPPVQLMNGRSAAPFESIVEGFAMPSYGGMDPTAVMAPFYALLFGMMLSDAGYGLIMAIAIPLLVKIKHPAKENQKLLWVLFFSSLATVIMGAVYNTWFGAQLLPFTLLDAVNNPMPVMIICMGVGVVHLFAGLGLAAYMNIKRGKPLDAVYDQLSWALVVLGLILLAGGGMVEGMAFLSEVGKYMAIAGVVIILLFAGREKKNPFARLMGGLSSLYGATSWISDILSYMRLFGMGLATGVIGMVINQLGGMLFEAGPIGCVFGVVILAGAHTFNLAINALGAYVHSCRLQYIEFFGKFYEEGGVSFRPLKKTTRYVNFTEN